MGKRAERQARVNDQRWLESVNRQWEALLNPTETCWQCGQAIRPDARNRFGWVHVENQEYPDHGAEPRTN